jgi:hypothetical protein
LTRSPVLDDGNLRFIGDASFKGADVSYDLEFRRAKYKLLAGKGPSCIFYALYYTIKVLEVFPNETSDAGIARDGLVRSVLLLIATCGPFNRNIVDIRDRIVRNLLL